MIIFPAIDIKGGKCVRLLKGDFKRITLYEKTPLDQANEFLKLQEILNINGFDLGKIKKYYYYKSNRWDIQNSDDVVLMLPSQNIENALKNYRTLLRTYKILENNIIDLRLKNKIILTNEKK